jgi:hypothetical protein
MKFISAHFDQLMLLPPDITEKIPAGHKCFFIRNIVHELDLTSLVSEYSEEGRPAYHPEIILSLLFCAYSDGLTRARAIAHKTRTDVVYMYLAGMDPRSAGPAERRPDSGRDPSAKEGAGDGVQPIVFRQPKLHLRLNLQQRRQSAFRWFRLPLIVKPAFFALHRA